MKLTTARLKKLIREELAKEGIYIPTTEPTIAVQQAIKKVMQKNGFTEEQAQVIADKAGIEISKPASAYSLNTKKSANPRLSRQPEEGEREYYFMIIVNILLEMRVDEPTAAKLAEEASYEVSRVMRPKGSKGIMLPYDAMGDAARMQRD